ERTKTAKDLLDAVEWAGKSMAEEAAKIVATRRLGLIHGIYRTLTPESGVLERTLLDESPELRHEQTFSFSVAARAREATAQGVSLAPADFHDLLATADGLLEFVLAP